MSHGHDHPHGDTAEFDPDDRNHFTQEFWDERYSSADRLWSGKPNPQLVAQVSDLPPGDALDAGCGEGADAIWLASRGWTVTGVDVSAVALDRAAAHAAAEGVQVSWQREDLLTWDPGHERFDLVTAEFMHLPHPELQSLHDRLAAAVRPGGTLLIVAHHADDLRVNVGRTVHVALFPSAEQLAAALDPASWEILVAAAISRQAADLDGQTVTLKDTVLRAARRR
jgi:2-polyprenyl-3-methyl-5-hydroxy-6-metoxy-1,4-benzoquinol methylase